MTSIGCLQDVEQFFAEHKGMTAHAGIAKNNNGHGAAMPCRQMHGPGIKTRAITTMSINGAIGVMPICHQSQTIRGLYKIRVGRNVAIDRIGHGLPGY